MPLGVTRIGVQFGLLISSDGGHPESLLLHW